ncbi:MAG: penicillin-binding protein 1C [Bacteroidales bacterium]|nr:penicillin-binding protein 1C [Bacteroidales bacterium]
MNRKLRIFLIAAGVVITPVLLSPLPRFRSPLSTVVEANDGSLLGARIADDGQWRFPYSGEVPDKFEKALLTFEDRWFRFHPGINPVSIFRAAVNNFKAGKIVSGGSTITMQVARIAAGNKPRTYGEKFIEMLSALKLELFSSKKKIIEMYASNAPFGGNTVGLEAAAWRYTGKSSSSLSWAEAASLAILPNSPGLVFPGRNQEVLKRRRDDLLRRLYERNYFDSLTLILSIDEPVPGQPKTLPAKAPHLTDHIFTTRKGQTVKTTIDLHLQERATEIINTHQKELSANYIYNSACLILEVETGNVLAYVGNNTLEEAKLHGGDVDIIRSLRSTGSILKPFLYAAMQQSGDILPNSLVADVPTRFPGFSPKNFDQSYSGAVSAGSALSQSLNIPAVKMLQKYDPERFLDILKKTGFTSFDKPADHYGLSMILGGGETSLWELTGAYASLSRVLNRYLKEKKYYTEDYHAPVIISVTDTLKNKDPAPPLSAASIWLTYEALQKVNRPESETGWQYFSSSPDVAWKTGTSFGFRDGWAVGTTPQYVIGVWVGNADGEGRPGLTGITAAAPILFDLVNLTGTGPWFKTPLEDLTMIKVCAKSGFRASSDCPETIEISAGVNGLRSEACPFHQVIHLNKSETLQVTSDCASPGEIINVPWFVLPPAMEYFYRQKHPEYRPLPTVAPGCAASGTIAAMEFIYPNSGVKIFIPRDETGTLTRVVPEIAHRNPSKKIFWHLDEKYIGTTKYIHQIEIIAGSGSHTLTAVDEDGNSIKCSFTIVSSSTQILN